MTTRADVVAEARLWIGTPYAHQHRAKGHAVDCAGLVIGAARALGLVEPLFDVNGYAPTPDGRQLIAECDRFMDRVPMPSLQPGDVLVLRFRSDPQHLGIIGDHPDGGLSLIHALGTTDGRGQVVEHRLTARKALVPVQGYAFRGLA